MANVGLVAGGVEGLIQRPSHCRIPTQILCRGPLERGRGHGIVLVVLLVGLIEVDVSIQRHRTTIDNHKDSHILEYIAITIIELT